MKRILLVGNPNSGKTTLFNSLTGMNEHVGNWHGVTVDSTEAVFDNGIEKCVLVDIPGIYSLTPLSFEEKVACKLLKENQNAKIINICDKNNLRRNLYLTVCLIEKGFDVVLAINDIDKNSIYKINLERLSTLLGVEVVSINPEKKIGLEILKNKIQDNKNSNIKLSYMQSLEYKNNCFKDCEIESEKKLSDNKSYNFQDLCKLRYDFIDDILEKSSKRTNEVYGKSRLDKILLNKFLAFPIFLLLLTGIFYLTFFSLGEYISKYLSSLLNFALNPISNWLSNCLGSGWIFDLFNIAIFGGISTILSFLPQVVLLFFFLTLLEDSGYLSRVAFVFEDILGKVGLSGKSVYTLLMGFGCSTTAIMTARNMEDKNAKIKTAILCPYMSCSAKIPIYTVVGGAFFGAKNIFYIVGLYLLGVIVAILISKILNNTILKSKEQSFILEFPPYRAISLKKILKTLKENSKQFLFKVGSIMLTMNVIVWVLSSFDFTFKYIADGKGTSILENIGKLFVPMFIPLGFGNWAVVASLIAGIVAKEVVVTSIAMFNGIDADSTKLLSESLLLSSSAVYFSSKASVVSFLVFCLLYTPCLASVSMLFQEVGRKWTVFSVVLQFFIAYIISFTIYNICFAIEIFGVINVILWIFALFSICFSIYFIFRKFKKKNFCHYCSKKNCLNCNKKNNLK